MSTAMKPVAVKIELEMKIRLKRLADEKQRSSHWVMREAIHQYVEREEKRSTLRHDAINAWEEVQDTGLHLTGEEVKDWLSSWGTDSEKAAPKCHK